ncbi:YafY family transcriptional regulator [Pelomonas sp. V22]|uniref:helix-turn-helix transcriptional regulator n=1 Tax=Pelomonas sp. V22 TaxID=2822139 RepID=UPI0024A8DBC1|nr:YafY family protein [Pelomonas sp. V22]MDI4635697.1 YafY family transcriptional regulator [Pelomonas sp. V22]
MSKAPSKPTGRVLALLEILQSQRQATGPELAARLGVEPRTVRRYVGHLLDLGVPVETLRGRDGGYALAAGHKLPPLMFSPEEALALAMGLRAARELGLAGILPAISSSQAKLERVLPVPVRKRIGDIDAVVALDLTRPAPVAGAGIELLALSAAARACQRVRIAYLDAAQLATERDFDCYGLAYRGGAWYAVGHCHLRRDLRSFRLDRVQSVEALPASFGRPEGFDVLAWLRESIATLPRSHAIELLLQTDLATARRALPYPELGVLSEARGGVRLRGQADDLASMARSLAGLPFAFRILKPVALRRALAEHARELLACNSSD